mmetsp:Transcript_14252/g.33118  ORF Transcript_14252/g.33118 Transcript_14252/m.33118 type:complete len:226 (+) Transcript_14252:2301-2978(+)
MDLDITAYNLCFMPKSFELPKVTKRGLEGSERGLNRRIPCRRTIRVADRDRERLSPFRRKRSIRVDTVSDFRRKMGDFVWIRQSLGMRISVFLHPRKQFLLHKSDVFVVAKDICIRMDVQNSQIRKDCIQKNLHQLGALLCRICICWVRPIPRLPDTTDNNQDLFWFQRRRGRCWKRPVLVIDPFLPYRHKGCKQREKDGIYIQESTRCRRRMSLNSRSVTGTYA